MDRPVRILMVEDRESDAELVMRELARSGLQCTSQRVESRAAFLAQMEAFRPDVVLVDYSLPQFSGLEALELARRGRPDVPVIMVTGSIDEDTAVDCLKRGAADYVIKENLGRLGPALNRALHDAEERRQRKRLEAELLQSRESYQDIFDNSTDAIFIHDAASGSILDVNRTVCELFGYTLEEIQTLNVGNLSVNEPPYTQAEAVRWIQKAAAEGPQRFEWLARDRAGKAIWFENSLLHARVGGRDCVLVFGRRIDDRKRAEEKIREGEEKYRILFENAGVLISVYDADGVCRLMNPPLAALFGGEPASFVGKSFLELHPGVGGEYRRRIRQAIETGLSREYEEEVSFPSGPRWLLSRVHPVPDEQGVFRAAQIVSQDVTEHRRLQSQLYRTQKLEALGTLAGGVAHDFNNILAIALGYTELGLLETSEDAPQRRFLEQIFEALKRGRDLTAQILSFSRHSETERKPIDAAAPVRESVQLLRATLPATIEIREAYPEAPAVVLGDASQIHQVMMNLCTNAAQAMHQGGGLLRVSVEQGVLGPDDVVRHPGLAQGPCVALEVTDTGCGMDAHLLEHIFDPFFTTKKPEEGSGIGLSVVHGIVQGHEGAISVDSEPGRGTTFRVLLPALVGAQEEAARDPRRAMLRPGLRVLFVDDEVAIADLGRRILERLGCRVTACTDGRQALEAFRKGPDAFDVVVTDVTMPHLTGLDLAGEIQALRPGTPVVACTGYSERVRPGEAEARGILDLLIKPVTSGQLAAAIEQALAPRPERERTDRPPRVLVVDDDAQMRDMLRQMLEKEGCRVSLARDGRQALKVSEEQPVDVLITDVFMPEMDGLEVIMSFRRRFPDVRILCLSGGGARVTGNFLDQARLLGAERVFPKPFDREALIAAVRGR